METEQSQQPQIRSTPYSSPMQNFAGSILLLTNPDSELYKLELTLRNMTLDAEGKAQKAGVPLLNDAGVSSVIGQVQSIVNQVTVMSNLDTKEIYMLVLMLADTLSIDLMVNRVQYKITNSAARYKIYNTALNQAFICMKRASEEGERRFWKGSQQEITTRVDGLGGKRPGTLGKLLGWK